MLWSQIKLTLYDFSDLQLSGKFENGPGTGRLLTCFQCVVINRTPYGARPILHEWIFTRNGIQCIK